MQTEDDIILGIVWEIRNELYRVGYEFLSAASHRIDFNDNFIKITIDKGKLYNFFNIEYIYNYKMYKNVFIKGME